jgi:hypothetical protein
MTDVCDPCAAATGQRLGVSDRGGQPWQTLADVRLGRRATSQRPPIMRSTFGARPTPPLALTSLTCCSVLGPDVDVIAAVMRSHKICARWRARWRRGT